MFATSRRWIAAVLLSSSTLFAQEQAAKLPEDFPQTYESLASLLDREDPGAMELARGTYDAANFFAVGPVALPYTKQRFANANTEGEASIGGLFITVRGNAEDIALIQRDLETNKRKRQWLAHMVGTEQAFFASIESGAAWREFMRVLPSTEGPRRLSLGCMQSKDALVRRAGMFWGYWFEGPGYWNSVKKISSGDADPGTRRIAAHLLNPDRAPSD